MKTINLATLGVRLIGVAVLAVALIVGASAAVLEIFRRQGQTVESSAFIDRVRP